MPKIVRNRRTHVLTSAISSKKALQVGVLWLITSPIIKPSVVGLTAAAVGRPGDRGTSGTKIAEARARPVARGTSGGLVASAASTATARGTSGAVTGRVMVRPQGIGTAGTVGGKTKSSNLDTETE